MALFGEDFDLAFGDLNSSLLPSENAVFNFSMKEAYEILAKEVRITERTYFCHSDCVHRNRVAMELG